MKKREERKGFGTTCNFVYGAGRIKETSARNLSISVKLWRISLITCDFCDAFHSTEMIIYARVVTAPVEHR